MTFPHFFDKALSAALLTTAAFLPLSALAQMPADGTVAISPGNFDLTYTGQFSSSAPHAQMNAAIVINQGQAFAPYTEEYLEISAPNSAAVMVNIGADCTRAAGRFLDCYFNYPLSTADMASSGVGVTGRYYAKKPGFEGYLKDIRMVFGQAGSTGTSSSFGSGSNSSALPVLSSIPPTQSITALTSYQIAITPTPTTYSAGSPTQLVNFTITPVGSTFQQPAYVNELIELSSDTGQIIFVSPQTDCTRSNSVLTCSKNYTLSASDLSQPVRQLTVRYYADRLIQNTQIPWTGFSQGFQTITVAPNTSGGGTQTCTSENNPLMPNQTGNGVFTFTIPAGDVCPTDFWIDPPIAGGYAYTVNGAKFESVTMPSLQTVNDSSGYLLEFPPSNFGPGVFLEAGETHDFAYPVDNFTIRGINPSLALDPNDGTAFATGVDLTVPTGPVAITQSAIIQDYPGTGVQPTGCNAWTQDALKYSIKASLPSYPSANYDLRVLLETPIQQALLADLANVRSWRPDTREINLKVYASYAGNGIDPIANGVSSPTNPGVGVLTSIFRSNTKFMVPNTWTGQAFQTDNWYRVYTKVNVMDYDHEWISPWADDCLYQNIFVRVNPTGSVELRTLDNLSGNSNVGVGTGTGSVSTTPNVNVIRPGAVVQPEIQPRSRRGILGRFLGKQEVDKTKAQPKPKAEQQKR